MASFSLTGVGTIAEAIGFSKLPPGDAESSVDENGCRLEAVGSRLDLGSDGRRQRNIAQRFRVPLPVRQAVVNETSQRLKLILILILPVEQHPGVSDDRIGIFSVRIGDPGYQVRRHLGRSERS